MLPCRSRYWLGRHHHHAPLRLLDTHLRLLRHACRLGERHIRRAATALEPRLWQADARRRAQTPCAIRVDAAAADPDDALQPTPRCRLQAPRRGTRCHGKLERMRGLWPVRTQLAALPGFG